MGKIKVKNSNFGLQVECKIPGEVIPAFNMTKGIEGIAIPSSLKKKSVVYELPSSVSLQSVLDSDSDERVFFTLVLHLLDIFQAAIDRKIAICKLCLKLNEIYISNIHSFYIFYFPNTDVFESNDACISAFLKNLCAYKYGKQYFGTSFSAFLQFINETQVFDFAEYLNFIEQNFPGLIDSCVHLNFKSVKSGMVEQAVPLNSIADDTVCLSPAASLRSGDVPESLSDSPSDFEMPSLSAQPIHDCAEPTENPFHPDRLDLDATIPLSESDYNDRSASCIPVSSVCGAEQVAPSTAINNAFAVPFDKIGETTDLYALEQDANLTSAVIQDNNQVPIGSNAFPRMASPINGDCNSGNTALLSDANSKMQKAVKTVALFFVSLGQSIQFAKQNFHIGSDPMCCDFAVRNPSVSKIHLTIYYEGDNYYLRDNGSTNGTTLNGKKLVPNQSYLLHNYDRIIMANEIIDFQIIEGQSTV